VKHFNVKHTFAGLACAAMMVASLAACGGSDAKGALPTYTGPRTPSTTATSAPSTTAPSATATGPVALVAHSAYTYGGLKVIVNLPADIPSASTPRVRVFSEFLQSMGRTVARNKLDPALADLAPSDVVKYVKTATAGESLQGIGSLTITISSARTVSQGPTMITGCFDQSKLVQVRRDGSHYIDAGARKHPSLKMAAEVNPARASGAVSRFTFAAGPC